MAAVVRHAVELEEGNFYGRDLIARILADVQGAAALPVLPRAAARDLGDDQDGLGTHIVTLLNADRALAHRTTVEFATDDRPRVRSMVVFALGRLGGDRAAPALLRLLQDPDRGVRESAVTALGSVGTPAAVDAFLTLAAGMDPHLRALAAGALARTEVADPRIAQRLMALAQDTEATVRAATLGGGHWTVLAPSLAADPAPAVRLRVAAGVRRGAPGLAQDILRGYTGDPDERVRQVAGAELGRP